MEHVNIHVELKEQNMLSAVRHKQHTAGEKCGDAVQLEKGFASRDQRFGERRHGEAWCKLVYCCSSTTTTTHLKFNAAVFTGRVALVCVWNQWYDKKVMVETAATWAITIEISPVQQ